MHSSAERHARRLCYAPFLLAAFGAAYAGSAFLSPTAAITAGSAVPDAGASAVVREWPSADGALGTHSSPLSEIDAANVGDLEVAWMYRTGDVSAGGHGRAGTAFEATPIMVDATLYFSTPFSRVIAVDAETGEERWTFDPKLDRSDRDYNTAMSRGVSTWLDPERPRGAECSRRIFLAAFDARLIALDARNGQPCPDFGDAGTVDLRMGVRNMEGRRGLYHQTAPPAVIGDRVVVGSMIFDNEHVEAPSGVVRAFDARSGQLRWSWEPLLEGHGPGAVSEFRSGAANTWATIVADEERDLLFVPTGSASPDHYGGLRPGSNLYANSLVALRASSGEVVWHFQMVHHDLWDYDLATPPALVTLERDGVQVPAVIQATKMGYLFVLHRDTGEPLFPIEEMPVPSSDIPEERVSPTQPVPVLPRPLHPEGLRPEDAWGLTPWDRSACRRKIEGLRSDGMFAPPSLRGTVVYPGFIGGMEWGGVSFDRETNLIVTNVNRIATVVTLIPRERMAEVLEEGDESSYVGSQETAPYGVKREVLLSPLRIRCSPPPWGTLVAVDATTGMKRWEVPLGGLNDMFFGVPSPGSWGSPMFGGPVVTGGLIFIAGAMDSRIRAFDLVTGRELWSDKLPASGQATPMTYRARPGGRQYLVIAAGGHQPMHSRLGDYVVAYALP